MTKNVHHTDEIFMQRAFELAALGTGSVSPNPLVGCVIVYDGRIIGEGWHQKYGEAHAEVNAVNAVADKSLLSKSTVYVTLEPCSHFGQTPPCADLLIKHNVKKVVISNVDSNPLVGGDGIKKLRHAGVDVVTGVLDNIGRDFNKRFFTYIEKKQPYIILKWAQTADGFIAREDYDSKWISNENARQLVHKWRAEEDAILVGSNTVKHDNPRLTVRDWSGRNPARIIIDRYLKADKNFAVFDGTQKTICYNLLKDEEVNNVVYVKLDSDDFIHHLAHDLYKQKIQSIIIEGGTQTLTLFIEAGLWNEARIFTAPTAFEKGIKAPALQGKLISEENILGDLLRVYYPL